jgi:hypothetical protein
MQQMKKVCIYLILRIIVFSCKTEKNQKIDLDGIRSRIEEQGAFVTQNALKFFERECYTFTFN